MTYSPQEPDKEESNCSYCHDAGFVSIYNRDGDAVNMPCPRCTEDVLSQIRRWDGHYK